MSFRHDKIRGNHPITPKKGIKEVDLNIREKGMNDTIKVVVKPQSKKSNTKRPYTDVDYAHYYNDMLDGMMRGDLGWFKGGDTWDTQELFYYQQTPFEKLKESEKRHARKEIKELMDDYYSEFPHTRNPFYRDFVNENTPDNYGQYREIYDYVKQKGSVYPKDLEEKYGDKTTDALLMRYGPGVFGFTADGKMKLLNREAPNPFNDVKPTEFFKSNGDLLQHRLKLIVYSYLTNQKKVPSQEAHEIVRQIYGQTNQAMPNYHHPKPEIEKEKHSTKQVTPSFEENVGGVAWILPN